MSSEGTDGYSIRDKDIVTVTNMGHLTEIQYMEKMNTSSSIRKLSKDEYLVLETGEVKEYEHTENRSDSYNSLRQTFKKIRYLINNNFKGTKNELFVTLTYARNETDPKILYKDFDKFMKKLKYHFKDSTTLDYMSVVEPQARGAWHCHLLLRANDLEALYLHFDDFKKLWGQGDVKVKRLNEVDNIGAYLSAYLGDIELTEETAEIAMVEGRNVLEKEIDGKKKRFIKGGRLHLYPTGMNIYRKSKGIVMPERKKMTYENAKKIVGSAKPHYTKTYEIEKDDFKNTLTYEQFNTRRL